MKRLFLATYFLAAAAAATAPPLTITGVTVVPMDGERVIAEQTVVVRHGRVVAMGPSDLIATPEGALTIDGAGLYLLPGLTDSHVHFDRQEAGAETESLLLLHLAHGVTTVQSLHGTPWHLKLRERVQGGELLGPRILTAGPTTATRRVNTPERAAAYVSEQKAAGYDFIKMYGDGSRSMTEATYARLIAEAHAAGLRVVGHAPRNHPFSVVLAHGQDSIDHLEEIIYTYEPITEVLGPLIDVQFGRSGPESAAPLLADPEALQKRLEPVLAQLAREVRGAGLAIAPTLVAFNTIWQQTTDNYANLLEMPQMRWMHPLKRADWGPALNGYRSGWADRLELVSSILEVGFQTQMAIVPHLAAAGVPLLAGTDAPLEFVFPGWALHRELELMVEAGLSPYQALRAATVDPAAELRLADGGTVKVGGRADLLLVEANPLADVSNVRRIAGVVAAGRWLPRAELQRLLNEVTAGYDALEQAVTPLISAFEAGDAEALVAGYRAVADPDEPVRRFTERLVNTLGYQELRAGETEAAAAVFRHNTELFPDRANVWDSYGEGLINAGRFAEALASYRRALEIDDSLTNPVSYVAFLEEVVQALEGEVALHPEDLDRYAGDYGERHVRVADGGLVYYRGEGEPQPLVALGEHRFMIEGLGWFMLRFELDAEGRGAKIVGSYADGRSDESVRSPD